MVARQPPPALSVIVPARGTEPTLGQCLEALERSDLPRESWELVVVVDAAQAGDAVFPAAEHAQVVIRLPGPPRGAPYARNRGAEASRGRLLAFVSAEVCVEPDTLSRLREALVMSKRAAAVCATYVPCRNRSSALATFFHLRELYRQGHGLTDTDALPAGCGMIRRDVFLAAGAWDEWRAKLPRVEASEFGQRVRALGFRILMGGDIRVTHLRQYTLRQALVSTIVDHGLPYEDIPAPPVELTNCRLRRIRRLDRSCRWASWGGVAAAAVALVHAPPRLPGIIAATLVASHAVLLAPMYRMFFREAGLRAALLAVPLSFANSLLAGIATLYGTMIRTLIGEPRPAPAVQAFAEVGLDVWPPIPLHRASGEGMSPVSF